MSTEPTKNHSTEASEEAFFAQTPNPSTYEPPPRNYWFHIALFSIALSIASYPYVKKYVPTLEKVIQPGKYYQRLGHQSFSGQYFAGAIDHYRKSLLYRGFLSGLTVREKGATEYQIARCYLQLRRYGRAIHYAQRAQSTTPNWLPPYVLVGDLYTQLHQNDKFAEFAAKVKKRFSDRWNVWLMLGNGYRRLQLEEKAIRSYEQAIALLKKNMSQHTKQSPKYVRLLQKSRTLQSQLMTWKIARAKLLQAAAMRQQKAKTPPIATSTPTSTPTSKPAGGEPKQLKKTSAIDIYLMTRSKVPIPRVRTHRRSQKLLVPLVFPMKKRK